MPSTSDRRPTGSILSTIPNPPRHEYEYDRLATVVEQANDAILITDTSGTIQYVNPAFERITGYNRREVIGENPRLLKSGKNEPALYENLWDTITRGKVWKGHLTNKRKNGTLYEVEATISPVCDRDGLVVNYAAVTRDVTQEIELETRMRQAEKMEAVGQLASGMAHDFNNVLTAILGNVGLLWAKLEKQPLTLELVTRALERIERTAQQGASLTRQLLTFNRREVVKLEPLNPNRILTDAEHMLRRLIAANITVDMHLEPKAYTIRGDAGQIEQILMNLVLNARDTMPRGGRLTITTANVELDELYAASHTDACIGPHIMLAVRDTGCGMSGDVLKRIYEPFFTTKPAGKGTGLGLATVYAIVRRLGGHITVVSALGEGAEFKVYLPASAEEIGDTSTRDVDESLTRGTETVLVCEDDTTIRDLECELLERNGYKVLPAEHGKQALKLAHGSMDQIDLLITDVVMPEMNGPALAEKLTAARPDMQVLFVSGYANETIAELAALSNSDQLLPKPFTSRGFLQRVRDVLDTGESRCRNLNA